MGVKATTTRACAVANEARATRGRSLEKCIFVLINIVFEGGLKCAIDEREPSGI